MKFIPLILITLFACDVVLFSTGETIPAGVPCDEGDTVKLFVHVENWVNADSINYDWSNGTPLEIITCDSLNSFFACDGAAIVGHKYFWSDEVKKMFFVNGGAVDIGAVWFPPSPIQDSIPYPVTITVYEDEALTILRFGPYIANPLYYNTIDGSPDTNVPGYNESAKATPNLCN